MTTFFSPLLIQLVHLLDAPVCFSTLGVCWQLSMKATIGSKSATFTTYWASPLRIVMSLQWATHWSEESFSIAKGRLSIENERQWHLFHYYCSLIHPRLPLPQPRVTPHPAAALWPLYIQSNPLPLLLSLYCPLPPDLHTHRQWKKKWNNMLICVHTTLIPACIGVFCNNKKKKPYRSLKVTSL